MSAGNIAIEVVYALPTEQVLLSLNLPAGTTLLQAVEASGLIQRFPDISLENGVFGIFGVREKSPSTRILQSGDRVEIYRALRIDPKEARRARADKIRVEKATLRSMPRVKRGRTLSSDEQQ